MIGDAGYINDRFRAMGTDVTVIAASRPSTAGLLAEVRTLFTEQEARFSRFRADSELSAVNSGSRHVPSPDFRNVMTRAARWHANTGGDFDPAVLPALRAAGYDDTFERVAARPSSRYGERHAAPVIDTPFTFADIVTESDHRSSEIRLPAGMQIDLSGIVKGWTVDRAVELLETLDHFVIDAGGDIAARGNSPDCDGWYVGLEDPFSLEYDHAYVLVNNGAVATSGTYRRRWSRGRRSPEHHLIDPHANRPSASSVIAASVTGASVEECEVYAKTALIRGSRQGLELLDSTPSVEGLLTLEDGSRKASAGWAGLEAYRPGLLAGGCSGA